MTAPIEHWMTTGLFGANASFQRAAREYAEEYAALAVAAERERWERALGAEMPADFKGWHQNAAAERPEVAAWVIRNLREREAWALQMLDARIAAPQCGGMAGAVSVRQPTERTS